MERPKWEYTLRQAAGLCAVSFDTIKRRLKAGDLPHARQLDDGARTWVVPLADLTAAGFTVRPVAPRAALSRKRPGEQTEPEADLITRLAIAEALTAVHAEYAAAFGELASQAIAALTDPVAARPGGGNRD
jgi:hypothetical protein